MIKTIGVEQTDFQEGEILESQNYFENKILVQYDSETTGLDCHTSKLMCIQLGDFENQFVLSPNVLESYKDFLEDEDTILIGHNLKFDLKFLFKQGIFPKKVHDTYLAEAVLFCGNKFHRKGLAHLATHRLNVNLDKSIRAGIWKEGLTKRVIEYSADDVKYLELLKDSQDKELDEKELQQTLRLENSFVIPLAYTEYCGFKLDEALWKEKMEEDKSNMEEAKKNLDSYIFNNNLSQFIDNQFSLFSEGLSLNINWDSPKQVVQFFKSLGIDTTVVVKGKKKDSVEAENLEKYEKDFPIVRQYLKYKEFQKVVGTYGQNFLNQISSVTGRLHTNFTQIMDTGRISSGGRIKETGEEYLNFQNIPKEERTRGCFVAEEGNTLVVADYSGQEQIILANKCLDPVLLEFYDKGLGDMHSFNAQKIFPELYNVPLSDIKKLHEDLRYRAKIAGFIINYGADATTIAKKLNIPLEDAQKAYDGYFQAFPGLKNYFEKVKKESLENGCILIDNVVKRKSFVYNFQEYLDLKQEINRSFWERWKQLKEDKNNPLYSVYKEKIKEFYQIKGNIERMGLNYPIQGEAASITKLACIYFFKWIRESNLLNIVKICNIVHDEIVCECPENLAEEVKKALEKSMADAGNLFCKRVPLKAEAVITKKWKH